MKKKRVIFIILVIIVVLLAIIAIYCLCRNKDNRYVTSANEGDVTRYEWIEMLCEETGMTQYENQTPYFQDVSEGNPHFSAIQSAMEWELLDEISDFCGDEYASGHFIALTAMKTIGEHNVQLYLNTEDNVSDDTYIELATGLGLMEEENLSRGFAKEECERLLDKLIELYFGEFWKDDMESVSYQENVLELAREDILQGNGDGSEIKVTDSVLPKVSDGTIVIFEYGNTGLKAARKVIGIGGDGTLLLSADVELDEILDSLVVSDITEVSVENILNYYGLRENISSVNSPTNLEGSGGRFVPAFSAKVQSKGFKISLETAEEDGKNQVSITVTDNDSGISYLLPIQKEVDNDCEYQAEVDVDKIMVASQIEYHADTGLKYAEVALDTHTTFSGKIDAAEASERILLCETPTPLGSGVVGVKIQIYLVLSLDGAVTLEAELPMASCVRYEKGKGICNFKQDISVEEPELKVNCEAGLMLRGDLTLVIFMCVDIIDAEADIGTVVSAEMISRPISMSCIDVSAAFPVVSVSVCGDEEADTLVGELGLSGEWEIISSEEAPFRIGLHYEWQSDGTSQFVDECTYTESDDGNDKLINQADDILYNTYSTKYNNANMEWTPIYSFDYPDNWSVVSETYEQENDICPMLGTFAQEVVVLSNERGVTVSFIRIDKNIFSLGGRGAHFEEYTALEVEDNTFYIGSVVAKIQPANEGFKGTEIYESFDDGNVSYALIPLWDDSLFADGIIGFYEMIDISIDYDTAYNFFAESPDGKFTEKEEQEVIAILASFRSEM